MEDEVRASEHDTASDEQERMELEAYLASDETRLGDVYRGLRAGGEAAQIASDLGIGSSNFVWNYSRIIDALLERELPQAPTVALQVARRYRSLLRQNWSDRVRQRLNHDLSVLERTAGDVDALVDEAVAVREQTAQAERRATVGIYVYSLPHYLRYPFDPDSGRTLLKVGRSDRDVIKRVREQARTTALPEEPVLLRIYPTADMDSAGVEADFHRTLRAFGHDREVERVAGREWFLTTTRALDQTARILGLAIEVINEAVDALEDA